MNELFGSTRDVVKERYALRTPSGFVPSYLPGWSNCVVIIQISQAMGANFCQFLITLEANGEGRGKSADTEYLVYVMEGKCAVKLGAKKHAVTAGSFVFIPPKTDFLFNGAAKGTQLLIFQKRFEPLAGVKVPPPIVGHEKDIAANPFLGNDDARLQVLLPNEPAFDMAVNIFTYQSGATLPFVETHIMEHGLVMTKGQGVYRLDADYHPVQAGDVIWMAPYCPQWFVAMGKTPAAYIYYKDVNRAPL
ncbi:MAG: Cupin 2 conserved barrel domain protein [Verrucomicrobiales bacterium]|nr:Cupin 2 conserved barrel domain protein [Verrucomicrobiales bacterium]